MALLLMIAGGLLAVRGFALRNNPSAPRRRRVAVARARLVFDLFAGLVTVLVFACFAYGPKYTIAPRKIPRARSPRVIAPMTLKQARKRTNGGKP